MKTIKNHEHSKAAKELYKLQKLCKIYQNRIQITKDSIFGILYDPYEVGTIDDYIKEIYYDRYILNDIFENIKKCKNNIRKIQKEYSKNRNGK